MEKFRQPENRKDKIKKEADRVVVKLDNWADEFEALNERDPDFFPEQEKEEIKAIINSDEYGSLLDIAAHNEIDENLLKELKAAEVKLSLIFDKVYKDKKIEKVEELNAEDKPDLTTPEGRQRKIEKSFEESEKIEVKSKEQKAEAGKSEKAEEVVLASEQEQKLAEESKIIEKELEQMPEENREDMGWGINRLGFFVQETKSKILAGMCEKAIASEVEEGKPAQKQGTLSRFMASLAETYRKDEENAKKQLEEQKKTGGVKKGAQSFGYLTGNIMKYGRTIADVAGWTAGSPLRYATMGAQFFSRGAEAAKEARLKNQEVIEKTRVKDINEAAEEALKIYGMAKQKSKGGVVSTEDLKKAYAENLPKDLLERLKRSEPGTATGILSKIGQFVLKTDVEFAIKHGKFSEASFQKRLDEFDKIVGHYGTVDSLAMGARYAESAGKGVIAGVQIESAYLLLKNFSDVADKLIGSISGTTITEAGELISKPTVGGLHVAESTPISKPSITSEAASKFTSTGGAGAAGVEHMAASQKIAESFIETAHKGDSVWKMAEHQLQSHYGEKFSHLNEAQKTYVIDAIKDKIAANPKGFGLVNPDQIKINQKVDFSEIFKDEEAGKLLGKAGYLSAEQLKDIGHNNDSIRDWVRHHPHEKLTSDKVRDILGGKATVHTLGGDHYFVNEPGTGRILSVSEGKMMVMETAEVKTDVLINEWLDKTVKVDARSGWFEHGNFLKNHTMKEVLNRDFLKWKEASITAPFAEPEYGSHDWWEFHDKQSLQNHLEKLLRQIPASERAQYQNMSVEEFLNKRAGGNWHGAVESHTEVKVPKAPMVNVDQLDSHGNIIHKTVEMPAKGLTGHEIAPKPSGAFHEIIKPEVAHEQTAAGTVKAAETIANLTPEKQHVFDNLIYERKYMTTSEKASELIADFKSKKITAEDFAKYYGDKYGFKYSQGILNNIKHDFEVAADPEQTAVEKAEAKRTIELMLEMLKGKK